MGTRKAGEGMTHHLHKKLKRLFDARNNGNNERDEYLRALVAHNVSEYTLMKEIERRMQK